MKKSLVGWTYKDWKGYFYHDDPNHSGTIQVPTICRSKEFDTKTKVRITMEEI